MRRQGEALQFACPSLRADPAVVAAAVAQNGVALSYADLDGAKDWKSVVQLAAAQDGHALWAAPEALRDDEEVSYTIIKFWLAYLRFVCMLCFKKSECRAMVRWPRWC